jgi:hypothetical protein
VWLGFWAACLGGWGDALQPRPAGVAGSSGGLTGSADPCLLALLYGGGAYHPQPLAADALGAQLFCARAGSHARQADDAAAAGAPLGGFGLAGGAPGAPEGALVAVGARPHAGRAWPLPSAQQVRGAQEVHCARAGCARCGRVACLASAAGIAQYPGYPVSTALSAPSGRCLARGRFTCLCGTAGCRARALRVQGARR